MIERILTLLGQYPSAGVVAGFLALYPAAAFVDAVTEQRRRENGTWGPDWTTIIEETVFKIGVLVLITFGLIVVYRTGLLG